MVRRPAAAVLLLALAGCGTADPAPPAPSAPAVSGPSFTNPVHADNFPDPGALLADGTWYAYGTNTGTANVPVLTSTDLVRWAPAPDALPELGAWASRGNTWAPEATRTAAGRHVLYYTARSTATGRQCIGAAVAAKPGGPYTDSAREPLVCQAGEGGSIDASPYTDADGGLWLLWKNDGNAVGEPTYLYSQRLSADGLTVTGKPARLSRNDAAWEAHVVEAPQLVRRDGRLYLFYSANAFDSDAYAVGYATCDTPRGPCADAPENPVLRSSPVAEGPGHSYLVTEADGTTWLLYHAWAPGAVGSVTPGRQLWLDRVDWTDGRPVVRGPTADPQPAP
ncbi:glycoside hydrolase family 43 protein [Spirilliplanes yamanashiensis]|uniref:Arabinan endo-1,5-alpha-L-arabinosidase n=1 Tax=Spirilliplanes yamanashiensis TaxID=42233 RepID=A0A8J3Y3F4_9ACTN|nr:glycoside hydrolase family 43 protein [Spirilliplanes yamanashiensis]MDP9814201.1 beta-xylosidase [Spirilliplanes yamanashiensis]GIJ00817.1 arabinan endo-1,5-alpha-L-arabinosidase [Spirilliplanes yamanashiensis]